MMTVGGFFDHVTSLGYSVRRLVVVLNKHIIIIIIKLGQIL
jgi:hypothetical protein